MARRIALVLAAILLLVLQTTLGIVLRIGPAMPDLYLLFVVYLVGRMSPGRVLLIAWTLGLARDCVTPAPLGLDAFALLMAAGLLAWAHTRFVLDTDIALGVFACLGSLVHGLVWVATMRLAETDGSFAHLFLRIAVPVALYNAALMPLFARAATGVLRRLPGERLPALT